MNNSNILVFGIAMGMAIVSFARVRDPATRHRAAWLYINTLSVIFPILYLLFSATCAPAALACHMNSLLYAIPLAAAGTVVLFFVMVSSLVKIIFGARRIRPARIEHTLRMRSRQLGVPVPELYVVENSRPLSFSSFGILRQKIFLSVGLFELLTPKELEAVVLHELYHVKKASPFTKFSAYFLRIFSPILHFAQTDRNLNREEREADSYAARIQGTPRHVAAAKEKISQYEVVSRGRAIR